VKSFIAPNYSNLSKVAADNREVYGNGVPFPFIKFDNFFNETLLDQVVDEFPDLASEDSMEFNNSNERKFAGKGELSFGPQTRAFMHFLNSAPFLEFIQSITGIDEKLLGDPYFIGGGLHEIKRGGVLKIHADFNKHKLTGLDRRVNVLIYLNKEWNEKYGGHFELWDAAMTECGQRILPTFNTLAIFTTTDFSYHGHPIPLNCPEAMSRKSLALYYYSNGRPDTELDPKVGDHSTLFRETDPNAVSATHNIVDTGKRVLRSITPPILVKIGNKIRRKLVGK